MFYYAYSNITILIGRLNSNLSLMLLNGNIYMIQLYSLSGSQLTLTEPAHAEANKDDLIWVDLHNPTIEETSFAAQLTEAEIPTREDMKEIEESNRFYTENGTQYFTIPILHLTAEDHREISPITFILNANRLITLRYSNPRSFSIYANSAAKASSGLITAKSTGLTVLVGLLEATINRLADILEGVAARIDAASRAIYHRSGQSKPMSTKEFREVLTQIGAQGSFLSHVRESLSGMSRMLVYLSATSTSNNSKKESRAPIKSLERDVQSLTNYVDYLTNKITFLLDTIVGLISIEQNAIIKIFSVAAVGFMPPTLVASIYGMNFSVMPELNISWGYPMALGLMVASAVVPLIFFRKKGWL